MVKSATRTTTTHIKQITHTHTHRGRDTDTERDCPDRLTEILGRQTQTD